MRILAIDTATEVASAAVWDGQPGTMRDATCSKPNQTSRDLFPAIDRLLAEWGWRVADLEGLALSIGPGSFTGLRIGVSLMKGLAGVRALPIAAVGTLDAVALASGRSGLVAACLDAKRGEILGRLFRCAYPETPEPVTDEVLALPSDWAASLPPDESLSYVGDGAARYREVLSAGSGSGARFEATGASTTAAAVAVLGGRRLAAGAFTPIAELLPRYLRRPSAEISLERGLVGSRQRRLLERGPIHGPS
jgi:tRNA threonylcarbamoyladenosine biosynthesis protein TsaB